VGARDLRRGARRARLIGATVPCVSPAEAAAAGDLVLLTVSDEAIEPLCGELAREGAFRTGAVVAHCCGALGSDVLEAARQRCGCHLGSMHPLQTFPTVERAVASLGRGDALCFCEGDEAAASVLAELAAAIGARAVRLDSADKAMYHAAAVMACNYIPALADAALLLCGLAGIDAETALAALGPLIRSTADNVVSACPVEALTGPVARGDADTVARHLEALRSAPADVAELYRAGGMRTVDLALRKGAIGEAKARALRELLESGRKRKAK
jgi:predicted short-subunit dehydrogenase-like oxidoreductase (DUF2520 family)